MRENSTIVALLSSAASVGLTLYVLKLRGDIAAFIKGKEIPKGCLETKEHDGNGDRLWTAEDLIAMRRSIFPPDYDSEKKVLREVLDKMLTAANWAPTHGKTEPWRFVVFEALEKRLELGQLMADWYKANVPAKKFLESKYNKMIYNCQVSSHVIAICMKRQKSGKIPEWEEMCSVACAVQNMHLVATAHGVAAYWSSGPAITLAQDMKNHLKLEEKDKCLGLFYVGMPRKDVKVIKGFRKPIGDKVTWVSA
ncbi:nitroreductase [Plasmopara halstedii]|uniref:Nitroreductase n=1 Tax=Plasmopara halstedii TaxID=4781 RepID=A0A0P1ATC5_PLAHL|nr:nitroreductase [Plasmopara halstedii]CEG43994.1 nitroreductase [Plasmopara halstedii]|eukprot:XP_024580363.1 nitroreductase [Plasmopara halstedii]